MRACRCAVTPRLCRDHGSRRRSKSPQARGAPLFAAGQLCHATGARLVPWRQPGGWGMKSLTASTAPLRPEPDVLASAAAPSGGGAGLGRDRYRADVVARWRMPRRWGPGGRPGHAETRSAGARGPLAGTLVAQLGSVGRRPNAARARPTARGVLTARVPRGTDSDGASLTAARLPIRGTDSGLTACVPRGTDSDGARLTAVCFQPRVSGY